MKTELGRKICDRTLDRRGGANLSVSVLAREITMEGIVNLLELAQKIFVLRKLFQPCLARELEHADGIVVRPVPQIGVEMAKEAAGGRLPRPPKIEAHLPKRLERRGKRGNHIINLKRRHGRRRKWESIFYAATFKALSA